MPAHTKNSTWLGLLRLSVLGLLMVTTKPSFAKQENTLEVTSSERNAAISMLYDWWGLFEAPDLNAVEARFEEVFTPDVVLSIGEMKLDGLEAFRNAFGAQPPRQLAHHNPTITVTKSDENTLHLEAEFLYQVQPEEGEAMNGKTRYFHTLSRQPNGSLRFSKLTGDLLEKLDSNDFASTYLDNRARATITQYLAITDNLQSDYAGLTKIMNEQTEVTGMFDPEQQSFNDRGDGVLRGTEEIANWLATRKDKFSAVAHRLEELELTDLGDNKYQAEAKVATTAWPHGGEKIEVLVPVRFQFIDNGERYLLIDKLQR